jgi:hypothetical protein
MLAWGKYHCSPRPGFSQSRINIIARLNVNGVLAKSWLA